MDIPVGPVWSYKFLKTEEKVGEIWSERKIWCAWRWREPLRKCEREIKSGKPLCSADPDPRWEQQPWQWTYFPNIEKNMFCSLFFFFFTKLEVINKGANLWVTSLKTNSVVKPLTALVNTGGEGRGLEVMQCCYSGMRGV